MEEMVVQVVIRLMSLTCSLMEAGCWGKGLGLGLACAVWLGLIFAWLGWCGLTG